jgi:phage/conjugal plasmid C-4 type zinc finger TraR family protein
VTDIIDLANDRADMLLRQALEAQRRRAAELAGACPHERVEGHCACGALIPLARLRALPGAERCITCQQALEKGRRAP